MWHELFFTQRLFINDYSLKLQMEFFFILSKERNFKKAKEMNLKILSCENCIFNVYIYNACTIYSD